MRLDIRFFANTMLLLLIVFGVRPSIAGQPPEKAPVGSLAQTIAPVTSCGALLGTPLVGIGGVGSAVKTATVATVRNAQVCVVEGKLAPAVAFRVELPLSGWTGRYLQTGCGGLCGMLEIRIGAADKCPIVDAGGFVTASTDMGHEGPDGAFGRDPQLRRDFAYRGVHVTSLAAKALIRAFYSRDARFSYFDGCSDGGREGLVEAQRYPDDFDGILAGAPAMAFTIQNSLFHGWQARSNSDAAGRPILLAARLPLLHAAVLRACDGLDGQQDGLISAPGRCRFDPAAITCRAGQDEATCLTVAEAEVARRFYAGPHDPSSGERLTQGGPLPGSELQWAGVYVPLGAAQPIFSKIIVDSALGMLIAPGSQPGSLAALRFDRATFVRLTASHTLYDATNPDLAAFRHRGGKLILFHGLADPHISPVNTVAYHEAIRREMSAPVADEFERLYLLPGMGHCSGGEGPSAVDLLTPLVQWVEAGEAPDAIVTRAAGPSRFGLPDGGRQVSGDRPRGPGGMAPITGPKRSRPIYPYPYIAAYTGAGDANEAINWRRGAAEPLPVPAWAGSSYFHPYAGVTDRG